MAKKNECDGTPVLIDDDKLLRRLRRARRLAWVSATLLFVSLLAVVACTRVEWSRIVPYLMWNHVAIIAVFGYGIFAMRGLGRNQFDPASPRPREIFARPVLVVALIAALVAIPNWGASPSDLRKTSAGNVVTSHSWHASSDGSHYFESVNHGPDHEITKARYSQLNRDLYSTFARIWVLFSFVSMVMWRFVALRMNGVVSKPETASSRPVAFATTTDSPRRAYTALIAAIWTLIIGVSVLGVVHGARQEFCSMAVPLEIRLIIVAMPFLFFGIAALFTKRSPFISPWIASLVDEKLGSGSTESFMTRLRPLLLLSVAGLIGSAAIAKGCLQGGKDQIDWTMPGFLFSGSVALAIMHLILRWRRVPGV